MNNWNNFQIIITGISNRFRNLYTMLTKRRTSKRFVLGESDAENTEWDKEEESAAVLPSHLVQKFQMTLESESVDDERDSDNELRSVELDRQFLRPPTSTGTLQ